MNLLPLRQSVASARWMPRPCHSLRAGRPRCPGRRVTPSGRRLIEECSDDLDELCRLRRVHQVTRVDRDELGAGDPLRVVQRNRSHGVHDAGLDRQGGPPAGAGCNPAAAGRGPCPQHPLRRPIQLSVTLEEWPHSGRNVVRYAVGVTPSARWNWRRSVAAVPMPQLDATWSMEASVRSRSSWARPIRWWCSHSSGPV
jgi:hypothetical protein